MLGQRLYVLVISVDVTKSRHRHLYQLTTPTSMYHNAISTQLQHRTCYQTLGVLPVWQMFTFLVPTSAVLLVFVFSISRSSLYTRKTSPLSIIEVVNVIPPLSVFSLYVLFFFLLFVIFSCKLWLYVINLRNFSFMASGF